MDSRARVAPHGLLHEMSVEFPPQCPPAEATPKPGTYYRLSSRSLKLGDATTPASWMRPHETRGSLYYKQPDVCAAHGLSLFADLDDVHAAAELSSWVRGKSVAETTIGEADGVLEHTPTATAKSHHNWWTDPVDRIPDGVIVVEAREEAQ